jgi:hypothetical protein
MHLHVDGASGISGDMTLGALVDLGVPVDRLSEGLTRLGVSGWRLRAERTAIQGVAATRVHVEIDGDVGHDPGATHHDHGADLHPEHHGEADHGHRGWPEIRGILERAELPPRARERALAIFRRLCEAEAAVHGLTADRVQLHEVGAVDAIVDIVGACLGLEHLGVETISCAPPDVGGGTIRSAHGLLPAPGPATLRLLEGRPVRTSGAEKELTTPTGAAILSTLSTHWGTMPEMTVLRTGFGAGSMRLPDRANVVRFTLGQLEAPASPKAGAHVVIEADVDDADPQILAAFCDHARDLGALDAVLVPATMKKGRAGTRLTLTCTEATRPRLVDALFTETTTIGCRYFPVERAECDREVVPVATPHGNIRVKVARWAGRVVNVKPEHDDCVSAARAAGVPLKTVVSAALRAALEIR